MQRTSRVPNAVYERNDVYSFHYHLIRVTKYRNQAFTTPHLATEMKGILQALADERDIRIEEMPDHVHLLLNFKPKYAPSDVVKYLKGYSAQRFFVAHPEIRTDKFWGGHLWSHSYYMSTLGAMSKDVVEQYIRNQYVK